jgi:hypothetical protein
MAQTPAEYFKALFTEAGFDEADQTALLTKLGNEKVAGKLTNLIADGTDNYKAQLGRVAAAEARVKEYDTWFRDKANPEYQAALAELNALKAGRQPNPEVDPFDTSKFLTKDDLQKFAQDSGARTAAVIKSVARISTRHGAKFKDELDVDAIEKIASENNLPLEAAYEKWIAPRVDSQRTEEFEAKLKAAREEGAKDALSRYKLPVDHVPSESAPIYSRSRSANAAKSVTDDELVATWNSGGQK